MILGLKMSKRAWFIETAWKSEPLSRAPILYEIDVICESIEDRLETRIIKIVWESPTTYNSYRVKKSPYFFLKEKIFFTKEEALAAHKDKLSAYISLLNSTAAAQTKALLSYDVDMGNETYTSPFTGKAL